MTLPEILKELEPYTGRFPMQAMKAAVEQREAITPELLRVVEAVAEEPLEYAERKDYMLHLFALFLLAQFREKRAYAPIVRMMGAPGETPFDLVGDTVTGGLNRILGSVYDGNPALLQGLVENEAVNEFVRSAALDTFLVLEHTGQMPRDEVVDYFRSLFQGKLEREHSFVWDGLVCEVADLPAPELLEEVRWAYAEGLIDDTVADLKGIERDIAVPNPGRRKRHHLIEDAISAMEWWACFQPKDSQPEELPEPEIPAPPPVTPAAAPTSYVAPKPFLREPKVGRNDPCLCGSGKKYKKCCGKG
jgi:Protein of unknown function (DUF1186)/SEC-C motif